MNDSGFLILPDIARGRSSTCCRPTTVPVAALAASTGLGEELTTTVCCSCPTSREKFRVTVWPTLISIAGCSIWRKPVMATAAEYLPNGKEPMR